VTVVFIIIAIAVGALCGALMGYETKDLKKQPGGWRPWVFLVLVAVVVISGAILVEKINSISAISTATKSVSILGAAVAFAISLAAVRKKRT